MDTACRWISKKMLLLKENSQGVEKMAGLESLALI